MKKTLHLKTRCQQRGIREDLLVLVQEFGTSVRAHDGATHLILNKKHCQFIESMIDDLIDQIKQHGEISIDTIKVS